MADIEILLDLIKDIYRVKMHGLNVEKSNAKDLGAFFQTIKSAVTNEVLDSHLTVVEGY